MKTIQTQIPEGYEIDKDKSTFELIVLKKIEDALPMSWEELEVITGFYMDSDSNIQKNCRIRTRFDNKNIFPTKELAEASLALAQLLQLRDRWNDGWVPNWKDSSTKYTIIVDTGNIVSHINCNASVVMNFKTPELRNLFLTTFKDLLEIAKPLL